MSTDSRPSRVERLVTSIRALPREELIDRIRSTRGMTNEQVIERQKVERRAIAEESVKRINTTL